MICCFFGHRDTPDSIRAKLEETIRQLIAENPDIEFMVGNQGHFDGMVFSALRKCREDYPSLNYHVVLAYMPGQKEEYQPYEDGETFYPEGLESVPRRFAIARRNDWMLKESDTVVAYIRFLGGGAGQFVQKAERQKKRIINLADTQ